MINLRIIQPYVPTYRVPFFERLVESLATHDVFCQVLAPEPDKIMAARNDARGREIWRVTTRAKRLRIKGRELTYLGSAPHLGKADAVIVPGAASCFDVYLAQAAKIRHGTRVGWWGHIGNYVSKANWLDVKVETALMRRCDQVFAYTDEGRSVALERGSTPGRVVSLRNTIDVAPLVNCRRNVKAEDTEEFAEKHKLGPGPTFCYLGGLDAGKSIAYLKELLDELWTIDRSARLIVMGRGASEGLLVQAAQRGQAVLLGYADAPAKALAASASQALVNPGRVGLVAVDALALGLPIVTRRSAAHAPEITYLEEGTSLAFAPEDPASFARFLLRLETEPFFHIEPPSLDDMVARYREGVLSMLT